MKPTVLLLAAFAVLQNPMLCCSFISVQPWNNAISNLKVPTPASYFGSQSTLLSSSSLSGGSGSDAAYGSGMNQQAMMESDMLITVDAMDRAVPNTDVSKKKAHAFNSNQPRGIAHRAFSVFLFNERNELLLTQRAESKITFPGVWTNTCCSHPLHGMVPNEADGNDAIPSFPGIKHAAIRKLRHELGIQAKDVPHENFRFLRRFHYWAADTVTYGSEAPWGEHEIDYVLFIKCDGDGPTVVADPEEVETYKYVAPDELRAMMNDDKLLWSPWFIGIMEKGGFKWWEDLEEALKSDGNKYVEDQIHYFDPPADHMASYNLPSHGRETGVLSL